MADLGPIIASKNTAYNGIVYRSRLEAFWARFFDLFKIEFKYEPKFFTFDNSVKYLPDFYIKNLETWIEIKGSEPTAFEIEKVIKLNISTKELVYIFSGFPDAKNFQSDFSKNTVLEICNFSLFRVSNGFCEINRGRLSPAIASALGLTLSDDITTFSIAAAVLKAKRQGSYKLLSDLSREWIVTSYEAQHGSFTANRIYK